jgi:hypothetical protein
MIGCYVVTFGSAQTNINTIYVSIKIGAPKEPFGLRGLKLSQMSNTLTFVKSLS